MTESIEITLRDAKMQLAMLETEVKQGTASPDRVNKLISKLEALRYFIFREVHTSGTV